MKPAFKIVAEGKDITDLLSDRLIEIRITDKAGLESDELTVTLDDRDGAISWPAMGKLLEVSLGYAETGLTRIGRYKVDEIVSSGMPQTLKFRGCPSDLSGKLKQVRKHSWDDVPLASIVSDIATRNGLQSVCKVKATIKRADQVNESDLHFLTRLTRTYDATATIKGGQLLVLPKGGQKDSASGKKLGTILVRRTDVSNWTYTQSNRNKTGGVVTKSHNRKTGQTLITTVKADAHGNPEAVMQTIKHSQPSSSKAGAKASSAVKAMHRSTVMFSFTCCGRADILAERKVTITGIKPGVDGTYPVIAVTQTFTPKTWSTDVTLGNSNDGKKGRKKASKPKKLGRVLTTKTVRDKNGNLEAVMQ